MHAPATPSQPEGTLPPARAAYLAGWWAGATSQGWRDAPPCLAWPISSFWERGFFDARAAGAVFRTTERSKAAP